MHKQKKLYAKGQPNKAPGGGLIPAQHHLRLLESEKQIWAIPLHLLQNAQALKQNSLDKLMVEASLIPQPSQPTKQSSNGRRKERFE